MTKIIKLKESIFERIDKVFTRIDKGHLRRSASLKLIPPFKKRRGGKVSYAEWAHVIGIFQTLIQQNTEPDNRILDVGCGTGLLGISSYNRVMGGGSYTGIDVNKYDIDHCKSVFPSDKFSFHHLDTYNATYAGQQQKEPISWNLIDDSYDLVTALSVWTHFNEKDAYFYLKEVLRVLAENGKAIISFFILDNYYNEFQRSNKKTLLHNASSFDWSFNVNAYDSSNWKTTEWATVPEDAIAVKEEGLNSLLESVDLEIVQYYPGTWKNFPGLYFQDILILKKRNG